MRDEELASALQVAKDTLTPIQSLGVSPPQVKNAKRLYRMLRKLIEYMEARLLDVHAISRNAWEAWRAMNAKFDLQNDAAATRTIICLVGASYWKVSHVNKVPVAFAKWEALEQDQKRKTGETVLFAASKREIFLDMLPHATREQVEV